MALVDCSECGNQISDKAISCPHCGAPLENNSPHFQFTGQEPSAIDGERTVGAVLWIGILLLPIVFVWMLLRKGYSISSRVWGFAYLLVSFLILPSVFHSGKEDIYSNIPVINARESQVSDARPDAANMTPVSAQVIEYAYGRNTVSADQQFKGKWILIEGLVAGISTDISDRAYVTFDIENSFYAPQATFIETENDELATLNKGQHIRALCIGNGDILKTPMLKDCTLVN